MEEKIKKILSSLEKQTAFYRKITMAISGFSFWVAMVLVSFCSSTFLPEGHVSDISPQEGTREDSFPLEPRERCPGRRSRRLSSRVTVDIRAFDGDYMDSLLEATGVNSRSVSPWEYSLNTDANRFPLVFSEANCLSFSCVDSEGNEAADLMSYPIHQEMMVLRRYERDCDYTYSLETELVTVGCTCVRPMYY